MQILDRFRASPTEAADVPRSQEGGKASAGIEPEAARGRWVGPIVAGAQVAAASVVVTLAVVGVVGSLAARADVAWGDFFSIGAALWIMAGGGRLATDGVFVALNPLLGTAALVWLATRSARRAIDLSLPRWISYAGWLGGYAAVAAAMVALAATGPVTPVWWSLVLPVLVLPALSLALAELPRGRGDALVRRLPRVLRRAVRPAVRTGFALIGAGMAVSLLAVTVRLGEVARLYAELTPGLLGGLALTAAQLAVWPNLGLWALAIMSGPGVTTVEGSHVGLGGGDGATLPMIPVFGALPGQGDYPWFVWTLVLVPILIGGYAARRTLAEIPRLASGRTKLVSVAATVMLAALGVAALDGLAGGSLGDGRLASIGPSAGALFVSLLVNLGLGAMLVVARDWWRLRR